MVNRRIAAAALFLFTGVRALVLPSVVRAEVTRVCPQARFGSLSFSVFLGRVTLEDVTLVNARSGTLLAARSASAPLRRAPGTVTLEEVTLIEGTDPILHRFRIDRAVVELAEGKLAGLTVEASVLDDEGAALARGRLAVRIAHPLPEEPSLRFDTSLALVGGPEVLGLTGSVESRGGSVHFELGSSGGDFNLRGNVQLSPGDFDWRHALEEARTRLPDLHSLVIDKLRETKDFVRSVLK
jgi:hypothetical protein